MQAYRGVLGKSRHVEAYCGTLRHIEHAFCHHYYAIQLYHVLRFQWYYAIATQLYNAIELNCYHFD